MEYLRSCWAALVPRNEPPAPADLEAHWCGVEQSIVIVTDAADVRVQVRPLLRTHDLYDVVNGV
jgi:hypothetical protein